MLSKTEYHCRHSVKLVLDYDRGTGIQAPSLRKQGTNKGNGFPVSSTGQALPEFIPAEAGAGMTTYETIIY